MVVNTSAIYTLENKMPTEHTGWQWKSHVISLERIDVAATMENAKAWEVSEDRFMFCDGVLNLPTTASHYATTLFVAKLEKKFEQMLNIK